MRFHRRPRAYVPKYLARVEIPRTSTNECPSTALAEVVVELALDPRGRWIRVPRAGHTVQGDDPRALIGAPREFLATVVW